MKFAFVCQIFLIKYKRVFKKYFEFSAYLEEPTNALSSFSTGVPLSPITGNCSTVVMVDLCDLLYRKNVSITKFPRLLS